MSTNFGTNDLYLKRGELGINANLGSYVSITDKASGGAIGTAAATVDVYNIAIVNQTTSSQTLTIPDPTTTTAGKIFIVVNSGSASFTLLSTTIGTGKLAVCVWDGDSWAINV